MLTPRQRDMLAFIQNHQATAGCCPSFAEMMAGLGLHSKNSVSRLIAGLEERGFIRRSAGRVRSIVVLRAAMEPATHDHGFCPHCGQPLERPA